MRLFAIAFGIAFGVSAYKNVGPMPGASAAATVLLVGLFGLACFWWGRRRFAGSAQAVAVAVAEATAESTAVASAAGNQVMVLNIDGDAAAFSLGDLAAAVASMSDQQLDDLEVLAGGGRVPLAGGPPPAVLAPPSVSDGQVLDHVARAGSAWEAPA